MTLKVVNIDSNTTHIPSQFVNEWLLDKSHIRAVSMARVFIRDHIFYVEIVA